jgi:hypothetical protein
VTQAVELLLCKCTALSSNLSPIKKKKKICPFKKQKNKEKEKRLYKFGGHSGSHL